jgi:hypothetical protein
MTEMSIFERAFAFLASAFVWLKIFFLTTHAKILMASSFPAFSGPNRMEVQRFTSELTSAQILALHTTAVNLVPAPGAGQRLVPLLFVMHLIGGSVAYLDAGGGAVSFTVGATVALALASNGIFLVTVAPNRAIETQMFSAASSDTAGNPPDDDNQPLAITKATGNFTAGNGTFRCTVYYVIEPTS